MKKSTFLDACTFMGFIVCAEVSVISFIAAFGVHPLCILGFPLGVFAAFQLKDVTEQRWGREFSERHKP